MKKKMKPGMMKKGMASMPMTPPVAGMKKPVKKMKKKMA